MLIYVFVASITAACQIGITLWLKYWVLQSAEEQQESFYPLILMGLIIIFSASCLIRDSAIFGIFLTVTSNMYHTMSEKVLRSNILFFDSNPIGRILTRFSKDMAVMDLIAPSLSTMMTYRVESLRLKKHNLCFCHQVNQIANTHKDWNYFVAQILGALVS